MLFWRYRNLVGGTVLQILSDRFSTGIHQDGSETESCPKLTKISVYAADLHVV